MKLLKEGKFITLIFGQDDPYEGCVKFDLTTGEFISPKGKKIKNIDKYVTKIDPEVIIDTLDDENYKRYLYFLKQLTSYSKPKITLSTILMSARKYQEFEKFYAYGCRLNPSDCFEYRWLNMDIPEEREEYRQFFIEEYGREPYNYYNSNRVKSPMQFDKVPKQIKKFFKENNLYITSRLTQKEMQKSVLRAINKLKKFNFDPFMTVVYLRILMPNEQYYAIRPYDFLLDSYIQSYKFSKCSRLFEEFGYDLKSLSEYIKYLSDVECVGKVENYFNEVGPLEVMRSLVDYNIMMVKLYGNKKYDKYPKNFLTVKNKIIYKYNMIVEQEKREKERKNLCHKELEWEGMGYKVISPKNSEEIREEGKEMRNCVASYLNSVLDGNNIIMFLRKTGQEDKSFITLEIKDNKVVQAKQKCNRLLTYDQEKVVKEYERFLRQIEAAKENQRIYDKVNVEECTNNIVEALR